MKTPAAIAAVVLVALTCAWPSPSAAADGDAEAHYKKGRSLYNVSEYRAALDEFKQAYVLHQDAAFLYNIAQCHRQLGNHREAVTFYKRFLKESPNGKESPNAPNRREIERLIGELEAKAAQAPAPPAAQPERDHVVRRDDTPPPGNAAAPPPAASPPPAAPTPEAPPVATTPSSAAAPPAKAGLHLELGLGGGGMHDSFTFLGFSNGTATGASGAFQLAVTYGLVPQLAVGILAAGESVQSPHVEVSGGSSNNVGLGILGLVGAMVDWRLQPAPTGLHFEGAICAARMTIKEKSGALPDRAPKGGGLALAAGYDWSLSQSWQFGLLARFLGAKLSDQGTDHDAFALSALAVISHR